LQDAASLDAALRNVDALLAAVGLEHGTRRTRPTSAAKQKTAPAHVQTSAPARTRQGTPAPILLRVPAWERYGWLVHGFSTRPGGVSTVYAQHADSGAPAGELNLGYTPSDTRANVDRNRARFLRALQAGNAASTAAARLVLLRQIHSGLVHRVDAPQLSSKSKNPILAAGDGLLCAQPGPLLGILTADCLPVLVADTRQRIVAAFHAGWRGTAARIVERGVGRMRAEFGCRPADLTAAIGPGIGGCCYTVGEEVRAAFDAQFSYSPTLFHEVYDSDPIKEKYPLLFLTARAPGHSNLGPNLHLDLAEANRRQLLDAGVPAERLHSLHLCTACHVEQFFSHRASHGFTGRMLNVIGIAGAPGQRRSTRR
jgi:YfiH family protein